MRSSTRGAIAAAVAAGLVTTTVAVAAPAGAADPARSSVRLSVQHTPNLGLTCVVGVTVSTAAGQAGGVNVVVERLVKGTWTKFTTVTSRETRVVKVRQTNSIAATKFRAFTTGNAAVAADRSNTVTCRPKALAYGSKSSTVTKVQKKLRALRLRPASTSRAFDANTLQSVYAFQKAKGLPRTGTVDARTYQRLMATKKMGRPSWCDADTTMCVDLSKQVGYLLVNGKRYVIPVSSGGNYNFFNPQTKVSELARTPRGRYQVYFKKPGTTNGPLGTYFWMSFFTGGYGIHGSASVPSYPASHGCIRVPRVIEQWVYRQLPVGSGVHVHI